MNSKSLRIRMVDEIRDKYSFENERVLSVMLQVPRHRFVDKEVWDKAYLDSPVQIGFGQTMSQPYTVAFMTSLVTGNKEQETRSRSKQIGNQRSTIKNKRSTKILEIGTGSGYQAAVLSFFFDEVYSVEIVPELARRSRSIFGRLDYGNVFVKEGSGERGWEKKSPFDAIMVTAGIEGEVPDSLFEQLKTGGVLVAPVGMSGDLVMTRFTKYKSGELKREKFQKFSFVPFVRGN